jgi:hypothetical protein
MGSYLVSRAAHKAPYRKRNGQFLESLTKALNIQLKYCISNTTQKEKIIIINK